MHRRGLLAAVVVAISGCASRRLRRDVSGMRRVRTQVAGEPARSCDLSDDATCARVREKLDGVSTSALAASVLRGVGTGGRPSLPFDFVESADSQPVDGVCSFELRRVGVAPERDGFVSLFVAADVTLSRAEGGLLHRFEQEVRSKGGLELSASAPARAVRLASLLATPPLPVFRDLERELSGLAYWVGVRAVERLRHDLG